MTAHTISSRINTIRVADAMHAGVLTCGRETSLEDVAKTMTRERVHCVVVEGGSDGGGGLWGVVSDLDLVAAATVRDLGKQSAGGSAASPVVMVAHDETLARGAQLMTEHCTSHLLVVDGDGYPVGVLSTIDIAAALTEEEER